DGIKTVQKVDINWYLTPRELMSKWYPIFERTDQIWRGAVIRRYPDLLIVKNPNDKLAVEIEHSRKSAFRMKLVLKSLFASGDYMKQFDRLIIYANENEKTFNNWDRMVKSCKGGEKPEYTYVFPLFKPIKVKETLAELDVERAAVHEKYIKYKARWFKAKLEIRDQWYDKEPQYRPWFDEWYEELRKMYPDDLFDDNLNLSDLDKKKAE
ncbi:MAG: hypothetical protein LBV37_01740, partial [Mycoplasmataceae bacterium]|nr:hypothetical protein [Mycoplasmataceae bacterium]